MARVTIEDCVKKVPNRFELVVLAARRAKEIALGCAALLPKDNDKPAVIALREIAAGVVSIDSLRSVVAKHFQIDHTNKQNDNNIPAHSPSTERSN